MFLFCRSTERVPLSSTSSSSSSLNSWLIILSLILINFLLSCGVCNCEKNYVLSTDIGKETGKLPSMINTNDNNNDAEVGGGNKHVIVETDQHPAAVNESSNDVTTKCIHRCTQEKDFYLDDLEGTCSNDSMEGSCFMAKCSKGCMIWRDTLSDFVSCQEACSAPQLHPYDMFCVSGCKIALNHYRQFKRMELEALIHDTVIPVALDEIPESVELTIRLPTVLPANLTIPRPVCIQYKYEDFSSHPWTYLTEYNCFENFTCDVSKDLKAHTRYRFRFVLPLDNERNDVIYSKSSEIIQIVPKAAEAPESKPNIISTYTLDSERIAIFWERGDFINGDLLNYKLQLTQDNGNATFEKNIEPHRNSTILVNLQPHGNYTISLQMVNSAGAGPPAEITVSTYDIPNNDSIDTDIDLELIIVGEYSIKLQKQIPLSESTLIYQSDHLITGFAVNLREQWIFVIDSFGMIYKSAFNNLGKFRQGVVSSENLAFKATELTIDWLNMKMYIVGENRSDYWVIARSDFSGHEVQTIADKLKEKPRHIQIDPINGFLFWIDSKGIYRLDLADNSIIVLKEGEQFGAFFIDYSRYALLMTLKNEKKLFELNFDGSESKEIEMANELHMHGEIRSLSKIGFSTFYMTNGTHMLHWNKITNMIDTWEIKEFEWCWGMIPNDADELQSIPVSGEPPQSLEILVTSKLAKVSWLPPLKSLLKSRAAWQNGEYDLEISQDKADNLAIRNIKTEYFTVENLNSNTEYSFRVRNGNGTWSEIGQARTWSIAEKRFLLWTTTDGIYRTNEIGENVKRISDLRNVTSVARINETLLFVANRTVGNLNLENGNVVFLNISATSIAYDWRGGKIYWIDPETNLIIRADLDGNHRETLDIFDVQAFCLDPSNGYIYYSTGLRLASRPINDGWFQEDEVEYHRAAQTFGENEVLSITVDTEAQRLYWIVGKRNSPNIKLYNSGITPGHNEIQTININSQILIGSLTLIDQRLIWIDQSNSSTAIMINTPRSLKIQGHLILKNVTNLNLVTLFDGPTPSPDDSVLPHSVDNNTIHIEGGFWNDFNITWQPVATAQNHSIIYKIIIDSNEGIKVLQSSNSSIRITDFRLPYVPLNVTISAQTYWRTSRMQSTTQLQTPAAAPSQPRRLRIFITRSVDPLEFNSWNISAILRWEPPTDISTPIVAYKIFYRLGEETFDEIFVNITENDRLQQQQQHQTATVEGLQEDVTYTFQVQAFTEGQTGGGEKTAAYSIHINPDMQSIPKLLIATSDYVGELDMDLNQTIVLAHTGSKVTNFRYLQGEQRILWVNENLELMSYVHGTKPIKIATMRAEVLTLCVDWISRIVYWAEIDSESDMGGSSIYSLDLCQFEGEPIVGSKLFKTMERKLIKDMIVLPFSQVLVWLEIKPSSPLNGTLAGRNLTDLSLLNLRNGTFLRMFEDSFNSDRQTVNLIDVREKICSYDLRRSACAPVKVNYEKDEILDITRDPGYIYALRNKTIRAYSRKKQILEYLVQIDDVYSLQGFNYQPFPQVKCLLPDYTADSLKQFVPEILTIEESNITLKFPDVPTPLECEWKLPGLKYMLLVKELDTDMEREVVSYHNHLNVAQLKAFTRYSLKLSATSFYAKRSNATDIVEGDELLITTAPSAPSIPRNVYARTISPTEVLVYWMEPSEINSDSIWYQIHWQASNSKLGDFIRSNLTSAIIANLEPDSIYSIWIKAFTTEIKFNSSEALQLRTFSEPADLKLLTITPYNMTLSWEKPENVIDALLEYKILDDANDSSKSVNISSNTSHIVIEQLEPKTKYHLMLRLTYDVESEGRNYLWPERLPYRFTFETLGDCPTAPGKPTLELISGEVFKVSWQAAYGNGAPIDKYSVEALQRSLSRRVRRGAPIEKIYMNKTIAILSQLPSVEELEPIEDKWIVYWNGTELSCIVKDMHTKRLWLFRVRAHNTPYGWGPYSASSEPVSEPFVTPEKWNSLVFAIIAPAAIVSTFVLILVIIRWVQNRRVKARKLIEKSRHSIWGFDDLVSIQQQQQQLQVMEARSRNFSQTSHMLYTGGPLTDGDIALLPQIKWSQVTIKRFLGSGFFGEVYEGLLKYSEEAVQDTVAIKTLRKGASDFEKAELLQEAQLMSNFKHDHIVKLIGVCFDAETISIIMEHMEGGDLLGYLRQSRPIAVPNAATYGSLRLPDMISMCADVATGCQYLEDMHFVHRDLACRNCLVSSFDPSKRIVKIGDFGLARDIYKNDYYRKEGEGLLPVRWMPPEALVDGVFTSQSDIWAFGVLCWEILTLGQQPYPARTNFEVLNYVKNGGYPEKPDNCPDKLFALLLKCWNYQPDDRPNFQYCLKELLSLKTQAKEDSYGLLSGDEGMLNFSYDVNLDDESEIKVPLACDENDEDIDDDLKITERSFPQLIAYQKANIDQEVILKTFLSNKSKEWEISSTSSRRDSDDAKNATELTILPPVDSTETLPSTYYTNEGCSRL